MSQQAKLDPRTPRALYNFPTKPLDYNWPRPSGELLAEQGASTEQIQNFSEKGFFVARNFVDLGTCDRMLERAKLLSELHAAGSNVGDILVTKAVDRLGVVAGLEPWQKTSKIFKLHGSGDCRSCSPETTGLEPVFEPWPRSPAVLDMLTNIFATPEITCFLSQFIFKDGIRRDVTLKKKDAGEQQNQEEEVVTTVSGSIGQPWHQDTFYFGMERRQVGVWIALTDADESNGCLWVVPGSHMEHIHSVDNDQRKHAQLAYVEIVDYFADESGKQHTQEAFPVRMKKGDVLFFDANIIHSSSDNTTGGPRATMLYHFTTSGTPIKKVLGNMEMCPVQTETSFAARHPEYRADSGRGAKRAKL